MPVFLVRQHTRKASSSTVAGGSCDQSRRKVPWWKKHQIPQPTSARTAQIPNTTRTWQALTRGYHRQRRPLRCMLMTRNVYSAKSSNAPPILAMLQLHNLDLPVHLLLNWRLAHTIHAHDLRHIKLTALHRVTRPMAQTLLGILTPMHQAILTSAIQCPPCQQTTEIMHSLTLKPP